MSSTVPVMLGVGLVMSLVMAALTSKARQQTRQVGSDQFGDHVFRQQQWLLILSVGFVVASMAGIVALAAARPNGWWFFIALIAAVFFIPSVVGTLDYFLASVEIAGSIVRYRRLLRRKPFSLDDITLCRSRGGYILVHLSDKRLKRIPLTFQDSGLLFAMLRDYRPPRERPDQTMEPTATSDMPGLLSL